MRSALEPNVHFTLMDGNGKKLLKYVSGFQVRSFQFHRSFVDRLNESIKPDEKLIAVDKSQKSIEE